MRTVFADTFYFLAFLFREDEAHNRAVAFSRQYGLRFVTTDWVLTELGDGLCYTADNRAKFIDFRSDLMADPDVVIVSFDEQLLERAIQLYAQRPDKQWSLTDCVSFVVMQERELFEALTGDRHFEQAGFVALLK